MKLLNCEELSLKIFQLNRIQIQLKYILDNEEYKEFKAKMDLEILGFANAIQRESRQFNK
jgi:hypothetical protein